MTKLLLALAPYIPKKWKFLTFIIVACPFLVAGLNDHIDTRIDRRVGVIEKTQDSIHVVLQENRESYQNLNRSMEKLNDNVLGLHKWLVEHR